MTEDRWIPMSDLVARGIYYIKSRNLIAGVWNPETQGFIGIREKFKDRYLFTEFHYDTGPPFGTVRPVEHIGTLAPDIILAEYLPTDETPYGRNQPLFDALEQYEESLYERQEEEHRLLEIQYKADEEARWQSGEGWRKTDDGNWTTIDGRTMTNAEKVAEIRARYKARGGVE